jgi:ABC-type phosphate transport system ATPase subunit
MFLLNGNLIEIGETEKMLSGNAEETMTNEFVSGAFG